MPASRTQIKTITTAVDSVPPMHSGGFISGLERLLEVATDGERAHRRNRTGIAISVRLAAQYFAVKWLRDAVLRTTPVRPSEMLHLREDVFLALALVDEHRPALDAWNYSRDWTDFDALDYVELVK